MKSVPGKLKRCAAHLSSRLNLNSHVTWAFLSGMLLLSGLASSQTSLPGLSHSLIRFNAPVEAANFALEDMDGERHSLKDYRGKVILLNFWATWCPPCRREMPSMENLYQKLSNEPFVILAINQWEDSDHVFAFMGQLNTFPSFPILFDPKSEVAAAFKVKGLPTSFIIDKQGRIVYRAVGGREFDHPEIEQAIRDLLEL